MENRTGTISNPAQQRGPGRFLLDAFSETVLNVAFFVLHFLGWGLRWMVATVFFLAVMAGAAYWVFLQALSGGQHVAVPDVVGLDLPSASYRLAKAQLEMTSTFVQHETVKPGTVLAQRPMAEQIVKTGRKVNLTIASEAGTLQAPNLLKKDWTAAREELLNSQFQEGHVARIPSSALRDTVLAQDPMPGADIPSNAAINVLLSEGDASTRNIMPNLAGMTKEAAEEALKGYGILRLETVESTDEDQPANVILQQKPEAEETVYAGQIVRVWIRPAAEEEKTFSVEVVHRWSSDWYGKRVEVYSYDRSNRKQTVQIFEPVAAGSPEAAERMRGYGRNFKVTYTGQAKLEIWEDGQRVATYYLKNGAPPVLGPG